MSFTPTTYDAQGREIKPGELVRSRTGDLYLYRAAELRSTPTTFGKVRVARVINAGDPSLTRVGPIPAARDVILTDFAFSLTVRLQHDRAHDAATPKPGRDVPAGRNIPATAR